MGSVAVRVVCMGGCADATLRKGNRRQVDRKQWGEHGRKWTVENGPYGLGLWIFWPKPAPPKLLIVLDEAAGVKVHRSVVVVVVVVGSSA